MNQRYLNVGSWNIEHFGRHTDENTENAYAIAEHVELAGVDILALQELYVTSEEGLKNEHIEKSLRLIEEHTGDEWDYDIFPNRSRSDRSQLCGIAWNASRVTKERTYEIPVETRARYEGKTIWLWDRKPHAVKFLTEEGKTDLIVVSLHMKSNVGKRNVVMRTRYEEAKTLMAQMDHVAETLGDRDIVLIGDTNCKARSEDAIQAFIGAGFDDLNEDDTPTYVKGRAPFDRIFVPRGEERAPFLYSRQYILTSASPLAHDTHLSDHYLIKTMVKIRKDDD